MSEAATPLIVLTDAEGQRWRMMSDDECTALSTDYLIPVAFDSQQDVGAWAIIECVVDVDDEPHSTWRLTVNSTDGSSPFQEWADNFNAAASRANSLINEAAEANERDTD
jgi:hypothetical protein